MTPLEGHLKGFPKNVVLDEKTMLSIARMIAYVTAFSTGRNDAPPEMTKAMIELDARLVDKWLLGNDK